MKIQDAGLKRTFKQVTEDNTISKEDASKLVESAKDDGGIDSTERADLKKILAEQGDKMLPGAEKELEKAIGADTNIAVPKAENKVPGRGKPKAGLGKSGGLEVEGKISKSQLSKPPLAPLPDSSQTPERLNSDLAQEQAEKLRQPKQLTPQGVQERQWYQERKAEGELKVPPPQKGNKPLVPLDPPANKIDDMLKQK